MTVGQLAAHHHYAILINLQSLHIILARDSLITLDMS